MGRRTMRAGGARLDGYRDREARGLAMSFRNLSPQHMFEQTALAHRPAFAFDGRAAGAFASWKEEALPRVLATIGESPDRVPLNPQLVAEWEHDGLTKQ